MKRCLLVFLCLLALPAGAEGVTLKGPVTQPFQRWADASKVPTVPGRVALIPAGSTYTIPGSIWFGLPLADHEDRIAARQALLHELGHQFDYRMPQWVRDRFRRLTRDPRPWAAPPNSPHEQFAEAYSLCAWTPRGLGFTERDIGYGYNPSRRAHNAICRMLRRAHAMPVWESRPT